MQLHSCISEVVPSAIVTKMKSNALFVTLQEGDSPLFSATNQRKVRIVEALLKAGAKPNEVKCRPIVIYPLDLSKCTCLNRVMCLLYIWLLGWMHMT